MSPAMCYPLAAGTDAALFAKDDLGRPVADAMGSQFHSAVSIEIACTKGSASWILKRLR